MYGFDEYCGKENWEKNNELFQDDRDFEIMNYYLKPYHVHRKLRQGMLIQNPFVKERQKTPSFNIYKHKSGKWKYNDFATGEFGDVYDLVKRLFKLSFKEAKLKIMEEMDEIKKYASQASQNEYTKEFIQNNILINNIKKKWKIKIQQKIMVLI